MGKMFIIMVTLLAAISLVLGACSPTPAPTLTAIPTPPPAPTPTLAPTPTPTPTPAPKPTITIPAPAPTPTITIPAYTEKPESTFAFVQGGVYGVRILEVEKTDEPIIPYTTMSSLRRIYPSDKYTFVKAQVQFLKNGVLLKKEDIENNNEIQNLSVVDTNGEVYQALIITVVVEIQESKYVITSKANIYFAVPKTTSGFRLRYRDLPLIDLGF